MMDPSSCWCTWKSVLFYFFNELLYSANLKLHSNGTLLETLIFMNKNSLNQSTIFRVFDLALNGCLQLSAPSITPVIFLSLLLSACSPSETHNHYNSGQQKSGFTAADPGDGSGGSTGDGGGGQGVECNDQAKPEFRNKIFVRDLFEAVHNHGRKLKNVSNSQNAEKVSPEGRSVLTESLKRFYGPASSRLDFVNDNFWMEFEQKISFIGDDRELVPSRDANSPIALPKNCKIVQIAYWDETAGNTEDGTLYVKKDLWLKLDQLNKIGLLAHEYFFKIARKAKYRNSDYTRYKVGQLLAETGLQPLFSDWTPTTDNRVSGILPLSKAGYKYCEGSSADDASANIQFFGYEGKNRIQHLVFSNIKSKAITANLLENHIFKIDPTKNDLFVEASNAMGLQTTLANEMISTLNAIQDLIPEQDLRAEQIRSSGFVRDPLKFIKKIGSDYRKDVWSGSIETPAMPIKIVLHNSAYNPEADIWSKKIDLKSKEELFKLVHQKIKQALAQCPNVRIPGQHFSAGLAVLNSEIKNHISSGAYPSSFEGWGKALAYYETLVKTKEELENSYVENVDVKTQCQFTKSQNLSVVIPYILYNLEINNIEEESIRSLLGDDAYNIDKPLKALSIEKVGLPKMTLIQDQAAVTYDLKCQNYSGVFFDEMTKGQDLNKREPYSKVQFNFNYDEYLKNSKDEIDDLKKFVADLVAPQSKALVSDCDPNAQGVFGPICKNQLLFFNELAVERNVSFDACKTLKYREGYESCVLMKMKRSGNTFLIRYFPNDEKNENKDTLSPIQQILLVPNTL